jgi:hypothetical protein
MDDRQRELDRARQGSGVGGEEAAPPCGSSDGANPPRPAKTVIEWTEAAFDDSAARVCPVVTGGCEVNILRLALERHLTERLVAVAEVDHLPDDWVPRPKPPLGPLHVFVDDEGAEEGARVYVATAGLLLPLPDRDDEGAS